MFKKNLIFALSAQTVSFLFSALMALFVPKLLNLEQYSYWQFFVFLSSFVGLFHFGLSDGIYLRHGGIELKDFDNKGIASQFYFMITLQVIICLCCIPVIYHYIDNENRLYVWINVAFYLIIANATWYLGYVFQAANRTSIYSISIIISKLTYILFILIIMILQTKSFKPYIAFFVVTQTIAFLYIAHHSKNFIFSKIYSIKKTANLVISNIKIGINLTLSNISSMLMLGIGRFMVDFSLGIEFFGLLSLSLSLTNFFLQFLNQVSLVLFPALRKMEPHTITNLFLKLRARLSLVLCFIPLCYIPLTECLSWWLPEYRLSLYYFAFLLPICIFDGKMQLLLSTYLKVLRKERFLLLVNIVSLLLSTVFTGAGLFILKNIESVAMSMTIAIAIRSIIANLYISKELSISYDKDSLWEIALVALFLLSVNVFENITAFLIYGCGYFIFILFHLKELDIFSQTKS